MKVEIRQLNKENIEEIIQLRIALQIYDYDGILKIDRKEFEGKTREFLIDNLNKDLYMFGTFVDDELVSICGFIIFKHFPEQDDLSCKVAYITSVFTKEEYRHKGYQRKVFEKCIEYAKNMGINRFELTTKSEIAMKMYSSVGFVDNIQAKKMEINNKNYIK